MNDGEQVSSQVQHPEIEIVQEEEGEEPSWKDKPLHSMYHKQIEEVADIEKSYQWLEKTGLRDSTEALIMSAQALSTALRTGRTQKRLWSTTSDRNPGEGCAKRPLRQSST